MSRRHLDAERAQLVALAMDLGALVAEVRAGAMPDDLDEVFELALVVLSTLGPDELGTLLEPAPFMAEAAGRAVADEAKTFLVLSELGRVLGRPLPTKGRT